jgi:hypothetical protein
LASVASTTSLAEAVAAKRTRLAEASNNAFAAKGMWMAILGCL